jgi:putative spermidine/putrescine transport system substrate-binding protein/spermidine/putrescine transport system substrate-binding protein
MLIPLGAASVAAADAPRLTYFTWPDYSDPSFQQPYIKKYGGDPRVVNFSGTDDAFTRLEAGLRADVAHPCLPDVRKWKDAGLLQPFEPAKLAYWNDLFPTLRDSPAVVMDGKVWMIPWEWGFSSVLYRTDRVHVSAETLRIMIDPKFRGRTAFPDVFDEMFGLAAALAGIRNPLLMQESDYSKVEEMFRRLRDNARFMWSDASQMEQALASGEIDLAWGWTNAAKRLKSQGVPVAFMLSPKEKLSTWVCGLVYLKASSAPRQEVYDFIDAIEAPSSGAALVKKFGFGHSNTQAMKLVPSTDLDPLGLGGNVDTVLNRGRLMGPMPEEQRRRLTDIWEMVKVGG